MKTIKVYWSNGDHTITDINGTEEEIKEYYMGKFLGRAREFNIGRSGDLIVTCEKVEFL